MNYQYPNHECRRCGHKAWRYDKYACFICSVCFPYEEPLLPWHKESLLDERSKLVKQFVEHNKNAKEISFEEDTIPLGQNNSKAVQGSQGKGIEELLNILRRKVQGQ